MVVHDPAAASVGVVPFIAFCFQKDTPPGSPAIVYCVDFTKFLTWMFTPLPSDAMTKPRHHAESKVETAKSLESDLPMRDSLYH